MGPERTLRERLQELPITIQVGLSRGGGFTVGVPHGTLNESYMRRLLCDARVQELQVMGSSCGRIRFSCLYRSEPTEVSFYEM